MIEITHSSDGRHKTAGNAQRSGFSVPGLWLMVTHYLRSPRQLRRVRQNWFETEKRFISR